jgi:hypothetical protein
MAQRFPSSVQCSAVAAPPLDTSLRVDTDRRLLPLLRSRWLATAYAGGAAPARVVARR